MCIIPKNLEIPSTPDDLIVHYLAQSSSQRSSVISVMWSAPENVERFDLEYYIVQVLVSEPDKSYLLNGTTTELEYIFDLDSVSVMSRIQVMVTAVSKCGKHSQTSKMPPEMIDFGEPQAQSMALNGNLNKLDNVMQSSKHVLLLLIQWWQDIIFKAFVLVYLSWLQ